MPPLELINLPDGDAPMVTDSAVHHVQHAPQPSPVSVNELTLGNGIRALSLARDVTR